MIDRILWHYSLTNYSISRISSGLIHETYLVGTAGGSFILQRLHPVFGWEVIANVDLVSRYLNLRQFLAQTVVKTKQGDLGVAPEASGDDRWGRLLTYIPGKVLERAEKPNLIYEAGKILGRFHSLMRGYSGQLNPGRRVHDTASHLELFLKAVPESYSAEIEDLRKTILSLPSFILPPNLPPMITHGDPKISNIIFSDQDKAVALIDLDGCNKQNSVLIELGDAFRSWCASNYEDSADNLFDLEKFRAGWLGYLVGCNGETGGRERELVPQAIKLIILELASRFLRDYFEDCYFGWNAERYPSRKAHNLARTQGQIALFRDLCQKESEMNEIVKLH